MGSINYLTSNYITMGLKPLEYDDEILTYDDLDHCYNVYYDEIKNLLDNKYNFIYFHVRIEPGYYEGFSIYLESNYPIFYDDYLDKLEALKEVTQLKNFLIACVNHGLVEVYPGWCTGYEDSNTTIKHIREVIREMREDIKNTPTWSQYKRDEITW